MIRYYCHHEIILHTERISLGEPVKNNFLQLVAEYGVRDWKSEKESTHHYCFQDSMGHMARSAESNPWQPARTQKPQSYNSNNLVLPTIRMCLKVDFFPPELPIKNSAQLTP